MSKLPQVSTMRSIALGVLVVAAIVTIAGTTANCCHHVSPCQANPEPDLDWDDHLGPVESIRIEDAEMFHADKPLLRQIAKFNRQGQKIETVLYRDDGVALPKSTYSYDSMGRLIKAHHYQVNGSIYLENTYTYDSDGTLKYNVKRNLDENKILNRKVYSHELKRNFTEVSEFDWDARLRNHFGFLRDAQCRVIEAYGYDPNGSLSDKITISYDDKKNVIEAIAYSSSGSLKDKRKYDYEFDERGNWIKQVSLKALAPSETAGGGHVYRQECFDHWSGANADRLFLSRLRCLAWLECSQDTSWA